jgi:hypothetical protein
VRDDGNLVFDPLGPTLVQAASQSLPGGMFQNYNEVSQITEFSFAGTEANIDNTDKYAITINSTTVTVTVAAGVASYTTILQSFVTSVTAITGITATYNAARTTLLVESVAGNIFTFPIVALDLFMYECLSVFCILFEPILRLSNLFY